MMNPYTIGIDIGTGSTKCIAITENGEILKTYSISYPTTISNYFNEQDPQQIGDAFTTCIQSITSLLGIPKAIGISSAMHSVMLVNEGGDPVTNLITWGDGRAHSQAKKLRDSGLGTTIYHATGTPIHPMSPICKIAWFKANQTEQLSAAHKIIGIKEFIWWQLFRVYEVDFSIASATGIFDIHNKEWSIPALDFAGISAEQLSKPVETSTCRHLTDPAKIKELGVDEHTRFCIGASDGCLANLGSHSVEPGVAALTIGTSGAIRIAATQPIFDYESMPFSYILDNETYIIGGPINNGGNVLKWFIHDILKEDETGFGQLINKTATINPGSAGLLFLPYLMGERAPIWNANASGVFLGVRNYHSATHLVKAFMEGICMSLNQVGEKLESKLSFDKIHVSGGITNSEEWMQMLANVFNKEVYQQATEDASALGAAYLANHNIKRDQTVLNVFYPQPAPHLVYKELSTVFQSLYTKLKPEMNILFSMANQ